MDSTSPMNTIAEKQEDITQEMVATDINFCINQVKEDIRSAFARLRKSLCSRELWLLDQLDCMKDGVLAAAMKREITLAQIEARVEECVRFSQFSKDHEFSEGLEMVSELLEPLCEKAKKYQRQMYPVPLIKFVHDKVTLKRAILSYGSLQTEFQPVSNDDADSCGTDQSWDLVDEKAEIENSGKTVTKNEFCLVTGNCCKQSEIEDMEFTKLLADEDGVTTPSYSADDLKNVCKANELCSSISDCVCEVPCTSNTYGKSGNCEPSAGEDSVSALDKKLSAIYQTHSEDQVTKHTDETVNFSQDLAVSDPVLHVSASVKAILSSSPEECGSSYELCQCNSRRESNDFISLLHEKLQSIIDGHADEEPGVQNHVPVPDFDNSLCYKYLPWENATETHSRGKDDVVASLHERLGKIHEVDGGTPIDYDCKPRLPISCSESDPILALSSKLQQILSHGRFGNVCEVHISAPTDHECQLLVSHTESDPVLALSTKLQQLLTC